MSVMCIYFRHNLMPIKTSGMYFPSKVKHVQNRGSLLMVLTYGIFVCAHSINRGYYTAARRYEFYFRVVKTIFYEQAQRVSKILYCV